MINPRLATPSYTSIKDVRTHRKVYAPACSFRGYVFKTKVTRFKTASEALWYATRLHERWIRLYGAAIRQPMKGTPS